MIVRVTEGCESNPEGPFHTHECASTERRCVWCGITLHPVPCNGCTQWMTVEEMHNAAWDDLWRCAECA